MELKNLKKPENRRLLPKGAKYVLVLLLLLCATGSAMAAGEPDPKPTTVPDKGADFSIWDIFDKKEIAQAAKGAWSDGFADAGGNLILGIGVLVAIVSIIGGLLIGAFIRNFGKLSANNDTHSKGNEMMSTAVGTAIMLVLSFCFVGMILAGWL